MEEGDQSQDDLRSPLLLCLMIDGERKIPRPGACPPPDTGRPLKKGPVFYALECGIFEQPSELFDSLVGFSILRGLFC